MSMAVCLNIFERILVIDNSGSYHDSDTDKLMLMVSWCYVTGRCESIISVINQNNKNTDYKSVMSETKTIDI